MADLVHEISMDSSTVGVTSNADDFILSAHENDACEIRRDCERLGHRWFKPTPTVSMARALYFDMRVVQPEAMRPLTDEQEKTTKQICHNLVYRATDDDVWERATSSEAWKVIWVSPCGNDCGATPSFVSTQTRNRHAHGNRTQQVIFFFHSCSDGVNEMTHRVRRQSVTARLRDRIPC